MAHPWLSRRVVYPLHERLLKRPTFAYLDSLEQSQWLSRAALERLQMQKLTELLQTAARHSPWHAERMSAAGLDIDDGGAPLTLDDLRRLPVMTKQDARANVDRIRWAGVPGGAARYNTGGSSGEPLIFYFGRRRRNPDAAGRIRAVDGGASTSAIAKSICGARPPN
jgi:phenylacetate-CoA ligase